MNLLYYPKILVPMSDLKKYFLYSDSISTIIPDEFNFCETNDVAWNESLAAMIYLESLGFYKRTYASDILRTHKKAIVNEFNDRVIHIDALSQLKQGVQQSSWWQLYLSKMDYEIREMLISKGLAKIEDSYILKVEADTAAIYMGLLAEYSCLYRENLYSTVTDKVHYKNLIFDPINDKRLKTKFTLSDVLPVPLDNVSINDILEFKDSRKNELLRFQATLNSFESELLNITDLREYRSKLNEIGLNLKIQSEELKILLKEHKILCITNTIDKVINILPTFASNVVKGKDVITFTPFAEKYVENQKIYHNNISSYIVRAEQSGII